MRRFKQIDAYLQLVLIVACVAANLFVCITAKGAYTIFDHADIFFGSYLLAGGFQVISCVLHLFLVKAKFKSGRRKAYHFTLLVIIVFAVIHGMAAGVLLLFISPVIAALYCTMSINELKLFTHEKV
jgi:hypothetical protein